ncbi:sodium channel protein Nach [Coccinella septempunctata]|uniref:sodium channel protein Nach n=1 Tax=Coccinella septempunctata TaxID=41139 RepID=UPI001D08110F|nr:sodium channel protein Nach [Coccinella septempunctata]
MEEKLSYLRYFFLNTSFHGLHFIFERERHWTERIFWIVCCVLSWLASILLILSAWSDFRNNAISFVVETSYLDWDTHFPSIAVCETDNQERISEFADKTYGNPHDFNFNEIVKELVYFKGLAFYTLQMCGPNATVKHEDCDKRDFVDFSAEVRSPCSKMFQRCVWNDQEFNCCDYFHPMDTEVGMCFGVNSIQTRNKKVARFPMISNKKTGPCTLHLEIKGIAFVYLLGEQEVPTLTTFTTDVIQISPHIHSKRYISIREIENQPEVKDVSIEQRKCRFTYESPLEVHDHYSYSACCVDCRKKAQLEMCGCVHHLMPNVPKHLFCDINGLYCLNMHYNNLIVLKAHWSNRTGLVCDCLPSCTEFEMSVVKDVKYGIKEDFGVVEISLLRLPSERYKRNVVRGQLDFVVSTGGITALFLGASILSFVEIVYYFFLRPLA